MEHRGDNRKLRRIKQRITHYFKQIRTRGVVIAAIALVGIQGGGGLRAQSASVQQLLLDVTKLAQFKQILQDLQTSYTVLNKGYQRIKDIAAGDFNLHEAFIDGLLMVNPALSKYRRVADVIQDQLVIVKEYKAAIKYFKSGSWFRPGELDYMEKVYKRLVDKSLNNLDALVTVLTAGQLRMSDDERLNEINRLYSSTHEMLGFLMDFNHKVGRLGHQRQLRAADAEAVQKMQGVQ